MSSDKPNGPKQPPTLLFVEDESRAMRDLLGELKSSVPWDLQVDTSETASSAIDRIENLAKAGRSYDVVVLDLCLPSHAQKPVELNAGVYRALRRRMPKSTVVLTTAFPNDPVATEFILRETMRSLSGPRALFIPRDTPSWPKEICDALIQIQNQSFPQRGGGQSGTSRCTCFISYSHKDEAFVRRLFSSLKDAGLDVWYAPAKMKPGVKIHEEIDKNIRLYDKLLLVISENSMRSEWVATEIRTALDEEKRSGRRKLMPIRIVGFDGIEKWHCFNADVGKDMAVELREYFILDFSDWTCNKAYEAGVTALVNALASHP